MASIEPGTRFEIEYGNGHVIEVVAMAGRKQGLLAKALARAARSEGSQDIEGMFAAAFESLCLSLDGGCDETARDKESEQDRKRRHDNNDKAKALWDEHIDAELAMEIAGKTLGKQALSDEEKKRSELPHSSAAESSAEHVEANANMTTSVA